MRAREAACQETHSVQSLPRTREVASRGRAGCSGPLSDIDMLPPLSPFLSLSPLSPPRPSRSMLVANFGVVVSSSPPRNIRAPSSSPARQSPRSRSSKPPGRPSQLDLSAAPSSFKAGSERNTSSSSPTHDPHELFPSDAVVAAANVVSPTSTSESRCPEVGGASRDDSASSSVRPAPRHHLRSSSLLEAAHIAPRDATWQCLGDDQGLCFAEPSEMERSWEDEDGLAGKLDVFPFARRTAELTRARPDRCPLLPVRGRTRGVRGVRARFARARGRRRLAHRDEWKPDAQERLPAGSRVKPALLR